MSTATTRQLVVESSVPDRSHVRRWRAGAGTAVIVAIPLVMVVATTVRMGSTSYSEIASDYPGLATSLASAIGRALVVAASTVCIGALVTAVFLRARRGPDRMILEPLGELSVVRRAASAWAAAVAVLVLVDAADINGQPLSLLAVPGAAGALIRGAFLPRAWLVVLGCVLVIVVTATFARAWPTAAALLGPAAVAVLAPLMVEHVLVGPNHDFGGDATILGAPAGAAWFGATVYLFVFWRRAAPDRPMLVRYRRLAVVCWVVVFASQVVVALFETEGTGLLSTATGQLFAVQFLILAALAALGARRWRGRTRPGRPAGPHTRAWLGAASLLMAIYAGADLAMTRIPPPQYFVPSSIADNFLGYDITPAPTFARLALGWRMNILFSVIAVVAVTAYAVGVLRLRRRGDSWPVGRTIAWVLGWMVVVATTSSGVGRYAGASFSVHMALHMSLNMFAPVLLVLGGPVTLVLRASAAHPASQPAGVHEWVAAVTNWRLARSFAHPLHALLAYTASYYVLYFSDIFDQANRYHWAHELMNLEFLTIGYLFFSLIIGVDTPPRPLPHIARLGLVFAAMPAHAFFGVVVMTDHTVIAQTFYQYLASQTAWITDLHHDQYVGGGIAWAAGEFPLAFVLISLLLQWAKQDGRQAARIDRNLDAGLDDSFEAYNAMLAHLAQVTPGPRPLPRPPQPSGLDEPGHPAAPQTPTGQP